VAAAEHWAAIDQYLLIAKPTAAEHGRRMGQTDRWMDIVPPNRSCSAQSMGSANNVKKLY